MSYKPLAFVRAGICLISYNLRTFVGTGICLISYKTPAIIVAGRRPMWNKTLAFVVAVLLILASLPLAACSLTSHSGKPGEHEGAVLVRVVSMRGPTSIGLVDFINEAGGDTGTASTLVNDFRFNIVGTADEILPGLINGNYDIALVPANIAAVLYQRTQGEIQVIDINTLGVLYVVSADTSIKTFQDLRGRRVLMTGKGTTPEYVMNSLLAFGGITDITLEYRSEATELAAVLAADPNAIAVLPEPYVTAVTSKEPSLSVRISLTQAWDTLATDGSQLVTGVTVVRRSFADEHPEALAEFIAHRSASVAAVTADPVRAGQLVANLGIIDNATVAAKAIPRCNLVCITGLEMKQVLNGYLTALFKQDPASIGGALPGDDFYYIGS